MILKNKKASYITLGCKLNFSETSTIRHSMEEEGVLTVENVSEADIVIINTCTVTDVAEKKARQLIRKTAHNNGNAYIIVVGCYAQLRAEELIKMDGVHMVLGAKEKFNVVTHLKATEENLKSSQEIDDAFKVQTFHPAYSYGDRTRSFLKIQDGCDYFCTYCAIPFARGRSRSATIAQVCSEVENIANRGIKEIILAGVNTGDFGRFNNENFLQLLQELDKTDVMPRYRISSIEPNLLTDEIINFVATSKHFMPHFHIPLQAGSDNVLALMKRRYDTQLFASKVKLIKDTIPDAFIGVDVIAGMRGETLQDFEASLDFISGLNISRLHVFPYSERSGTKALDIPLIVSQEEKHRRVERLLELSRKKLEAFYAQFIGTTRSVLFEESVKDNTIHGFTDNYIKISHPYSKDLENTICSVEISHDNAIVSLEE